MPREFKPIYRTKVDDIYIRVDKVITPCRCIVPNCKEIGCYDIQFEQPEGLSFMGGVFCKNHLECIFNSSIVESEVQDRDSNCILTNDRQKGTLLKLLAEENDMVLSQAYLYAKNLCYYGVDIAQKWSTVTLQAEALGRAYCKGRYDEAERWANKDADKEQEE